MWVGWPGPCECPCDMIGDEREGGKDEDEEWGEGQEWEKQFTEFLKKGDAAKKTGKEKGNPFLKLLGSLRGRQHHRVRLMSHDIDFHLQVASSPPPPS